MITIYHNPRCRKSREALEILKHKNLELYIVQYLQDTLNVGQLIQIISLLGIEPSALVRKNEKDWKDNFSESLISDQGFKYENVSFTKIASLKRR